MVAIDSKDREIASLRQWAEHVMAVLRSPSDELLRDVPSIAADVARDILHKAADAIEREVRL